MAELLPAPHASDPKKRTGEPEDIGLRLGLWGWVRDSDDGKEHFACITHLGSNYVRFTGLDDRSEWRVHFDEFFATCRIETDPDSVIATRIEQSKHEAARIAGEIQKLCLRLGVAERVGLEMAPEEEEGATHALARLSGQNDIGKYKRSLIRAREKQLPELYKELKEAHETLALWMSAGLLPIKAQVGDLGSIQKTLAGRIFNVELYAGLAETVTQIADGAAATLDAKLHVFQRRHYMDEECLLDYDKGGMNIDDIAEFDAWLARPHNRDRILPFPRSLVAFRVRRHSKEYEDDEGPADTLALLIRIALEKADKKTFLYIRNGERLYRLDAELDFGPTLFPDKALFASGQKLWWKVRGYYGDSDDGRFITDADYQQRLNDYEALKQKYAEREKKHELWKQEHPDSPDDESPWHVPWHDHRVSDAHRQIEDFEPFDPSSVYFDDMHAEIQEQALQYNRIAMIIQGLFDRSEVLHPHPPVRLWEADGFAAAIRLMRDSDLALHAGPPPDIDAYLARNREQLKEGSITLGQERVWAMREGTKEYEARRRRGHSYAGDRPRPHFPFGNPGPGTLARIARWQPRVRKATFRWKRERMGGDSWSRRRGNDELDTSCTISADLLFNVSAYKPGDYLQFFLDPRTRERYLRWAPLMLHAEDYHAGKLKVGGDENDASAVEADESDGEESAD